MKEVLFCKLDMCCDPTAKALYKLGGMYVHMAKTFLLVPTQNHICILNIQAFHSHLILLFFYNVFALFLRWAVYSKHSHLLVFCLLFLMPLRRVPYVDEVII